MARWFPLGTPSPLLTQRSARVLKFLILKTFENSRLAQGGESKRGLFCQTPRWIHRRARLTIKGAAD